MPTTHEGVPVAVGLFGVQVVTIQVGDTPLLETQAGSGVGAVSGYLAQVVTMKFGLAPTVTPGTNGQVVESTAVGGERFAEVQVTLM